MNKKLGVELPLRHGNKAWVVAALVRRSERVARPLTKPTVQEVAAQIAVSLTRSLLLLVHARQTLPGGYPSWQGPAE